MTSSGLRRRDVLLAVSASGGSLALAGCTDGYPNESPESRAGAAMAAGDGYGAVYGSGYGTE